MSRQPPPNAEATHDDVHVAVIDDDPASIQMMTLALRDIGCTVTPFTDPNAGLGQLADHPVDIVVTDLRMPGKDGLEVLEEVKKRSPATDVILVTGDADKEAAIRALRLGAFDFLEKPVHRDELQETVKRTVRFRTIVQERDRYADQLSYVATRESKRWGIQGFVGTSEATLRTLSEIRSLQRSGKTTVLLMGESGTGKELVAKAIHAGSDRASRPFVAVNCSAIPDDLAESLLFGHLRGSFTGAVGDRKGSFDLADGGTLFLDEIGDMSPMIQTKLLRILEDSIVEPVGSSKGHKVNVRVVAATNADLQKKIELGEFRTDLYHRLAAYLLVLPPLRERVADIPPLAAHFARMLSTEMGTPLPTITREAMDKLATHAYPGNVRELKNVVGRALIRCGGGDITAEHVQFLPTTHAGPLSAPPPDALTTGEPDETTLPYNIDELERLAIRRALKASNGNVSEASRLLGIGRTQLYRKLPQV